jgi:hypothetical protein
MEGISEILDGFLFLGDSSFEFSTIEMLQITHILCCHEEEFTKQVSNDTIIKKIPLSDFGYSDIISAIPECIEFLGKTELCGGER